MTKTAKPISIPAFLREREQWVVWVLQDDVKLPLQIGAVREYRKREDTATGRVFSVTAAHGNAHAPANFTTYEEARALAEWMTLYSGTSLPFGIGYALKEDADVVVFDFDDVVDAATGKVTDKRIARVLEDLDTYCDYSPSGAGIHAYVAVSPKLKRTMQERISSFCSFMPRKSEAGRHSVFVAGGYVTVTGREVPREAYGATKREGRFNEDAGEWVGEWYARRFPGERGEAEAMFGSTPRTSATFDDLDDGGIRAQVDDALNTISADCDRDTWVRVGMVLHGLTGGDERGLAMWDAWSKRAPERYPSQRQPSTAKLYRSFAIDSVRSVRLGTLLHMAKEERQRRKGIAKGAGKSVVVGQREVQQEVDSAQQELAQAVEQAQATLRDLVAKRGVPAPSEPSLGLVKDETKWPKGANVIDASALQAEPTYWLWHNVIPFGHLTMLTGAVGSGKSSLLLKLIADVTRNKVNPLKYDEDVMAWTKAVRAQFGEERSEMYRRSGHAYFLTAEMHWTQSVMPMLTANGAKLERVHLLKSTYSKERDEETGRVARRKRTFDFMRDMALFVRDIERRRIIPDLIVLDPLSSFLGSTIDRNVEADVRQALETLAEFCAFMGTALVCVVHQAKSTEYSGVNKIHGSVAFSAVARVVLELEATVHEPQTAEEGKGSWEGTNAPSGTTEFSLQVLKSNIGPTKEAGVWEFEVREDAQRGRVVKYVRRTTAQEYGARKLRAMMKQKEQTSLAHQRVGKQLEKAQERREDRNKKHAEVCEDAKRSVQEKHVPSEYALLHSLAQRHDYSTTYLQQLVRARFKVEKKEGRIVLIERAKEGGREDV